METIIIVFVAIQPLLDLHFFFDSNENKIFNFAIPTIIRFLFILVILFFIFLTKKKCRYKKLFSYYFIFYFVYSIIHVFYLKLSSAKSYSLVAESFYLIRHLLPISLAFVILNLNIKKEDLKRMITILIFAIAGSIVVLNVLGLSLGSYSHLPTSTKIYEWPYLKDASFYLIATKGLFMYANQISALLLFLGILNLNNIIGKSKAIILITQTILVLAMLMLGTKTAFYGSILIISSYFLLYFIKNFTILNKIKYLLIIINSIILLLFITPLSPATIRSRDYDKRLNSFLSSEQLILNSLDDAVSEGDLDKIKNILHDNYKVFFIPESIILKKYSYLDHPLFWVRIFNLPKKSRMENRIIQEEIAKDVSSISKDKNERNFLNLFFGIGYGVSNSNFPIERDFLSHYYNMGILGLVIFVSPYLYMFFLIFLYYLNSDKKRHNILFISVMISFFLLLFSAFFSGNVIDSLFVMIVFSFFMSGFLNIFQVNYEISDNTKESFIENIFKKIKYKDYKSFLTYLNSNSYFSKTLMIVTANSETIRLGARDAMYSKMLMDDKVLILPDGIGLVKLGNFLGYDIKERITGIDLSDDLLKKANAEHLKLSVLGCEKKVLKKFSKILDDKYPNIKKGIFADGYSDINKSIKSIINDNFDILFVALGVGRQEMIIYNNLKKIKKGICIGIGGSIDVLSGHKKRAPKLLIKLNLEWFYRIAMEPKRLSRFIKSNTLFLLHILKIKMRNLCLKK